MIAKTDKEIKILREAGKILAEILYKVSERALPSTTSSELDDYAEKLILEYGALPSFKNYKDKETGKIFPASLCVSINDEVVHGIPSLQKIFQESDLIGLDLGLKWPAENGFFVDMAITVPIGKIDENARKLLETGKKCLVFGIEKIKKDGFLGDVGETTQKCAEQNGFKVIKNLVGHGVGKKVHENPIVPNWGTTGTGEKIKKGLVIAFEPMISEESEKVILDKNGWTWKTADKSRAVHFEHTVLVGENGPEILTKTD